jgi:hypothetical protein
VVLCGRAHGDAPHGELEPGEEASDESQSDNEGGDSRLWNGQTTEGDHLAAPRITDRKDVDADPADDLRLQENSHPDGHDAYGDDGAASHPAYQHQVDEGGDDHGSADPEDRRDREWKLARPCRGVRAYEQQSRVREVDDTGRLEDEDEAQRQQGVDRAERDPTDQELSEVLHVVPRRLGLYFRSGAVLGPEVGAQHLWVQLHFLGTPVSDAPAEIEHGYSIGNAHDQAHVVLDQQDRDVQAVTDIANEMGHASCFVGVHPGCRLVEKQQAGLDAQGACHLHPLLVAIRQRAHGLFELVCDPDEIGDLRDPFAMEPPLTTGPGGPQSAGDEPRSGEVVAA